MASFADALRRPRPRPAEPAAPPPEGNVQTQEDVSARPAPKQQPSLAELLQRRHGDMMRQENDLVANLNRPASFTDAMTALARGFQTGQGASAEFNQMRQAELQRTGLASQIMGRQFNREIQIGNAIATEAKRGDERAKLVYEMTGGNPRLMGSVFEIGSRMEAEGNPMDTAEEIMSALSEAVRQTGEQTPWDVTQGKADLDRRLAEARIRAADASAAKARRPSGQFINVFDPKGKHIGTMRADDPRLTGLAESGHQFTKIGTVQAATTEEALPILAGKGPRDRTKQDISQQRGAMAQISSILSQMKETGGGAFGFKGAANEALGGALGQLDQILNTDMAGALSEGLTGMSPEEATALRSKAMTITTSMLSAITGEESGRYTQAERDLADRIMKTMSPGASPDQIEGALKQALGLAALTDYRLSGNLGSERINWTDEQQVRGMATRLLDLGLDPETTTRLLRELRTFDQLNQGVP